MKTNSNHQLLQSYSLMKVVFVRGLLLFFGGFSGVVSTYARDFTFTSELGAQSRYFPQNPAYEDQFSGIQSSLIFSGDGRWVSDDRKSRIKFEPFLRLDNRDEKRTHGDIRELNYSRKFSNFDMFLGIAQIFWGVTESRNVVDIINQFDTVENSDETDKLGQSLIRIGTFTEIGRLEAYYLPHFRERIFPGKDGRQRSNLIVDTDKTEYERSGDKYAGDIALRYSTQLDQFDIGGHVFYGTSRSPFLIVSANGERLTPYYQKLAQGGIDLQWTSEEWLYKLEAVLARSGGDTYISTVAGFEYTFFDIYTSGMDVGVLIEGLYDNRDETRVPLTLFENDVFLGTRLTWNDIADTSLLAGGIIDIETGAIFASVEFEKRLGESYSFKTEIQFLVSPDDDPLAQQDSDSNFTLRLTRFF
jgi:hypothetical protein